MIKLLSTYSNRLFLRVLLLTLPLLPIAVPVFGPSLVQAQIYNCDGKWTNKPCSGEVEGSFDEVVREPVSETELLQRQKLSMLHDLRMDAIEAERNYDIEVDLTQAERICSERETGEEECRESIESVRRQINEQKAVLKPREADDDEGEGRERRGGDENVAIVINEDRSCPYHLRRHNRCPPRFGGRPGGHDDDIIITPRPSTPPKFTPGPFHRVRPERAVDPTRRNN